MSMTNASTTFGAVRRPEVAHPRDEAARGRSPYQAITVIRSFEGVARQIAESIRNRQIHSGERLPTERELSSTFGVSRGDIREAIKVLGAPGLVEARQGTGIYVRNNVPTVTRAFTFSDSPDAESIERLFEFRCTLEVETAHLAALRRSDDELAAIAAAAEATARALALGDWGEFGVDDNAFHAAVARVSGNPYLEVAIATAREMLHSVVSLISDRAGSVTSAVVHHHAIVEAISTRQPDAAGRAMADHIVYTENAVTQYIPSSITDAMVSHSSNERVA
jgi:GntR family transcriptional regulator, transcriptional repressor for pyruvate dehydrogenase complex